MFFLLICWSDYKGSEYCMNTDSFKYSNILLAKEVYNIQHADIKRAMAVMVYLGKTWAA